MVAEDLMEMLAAMLLQVAAGITATSRIILAAAVVVVMPGNCRDHVELAKNVVDFLGDNSRTSKSSMMMKTVHDA